MNLDDLARLVEKAGEFQDEQRGVVTEGGVIMGATRGAITREKCARMRAQMAQDIEDPRHGTAIGYAYGCPCERCRKEGKEAHARIRRKPRGEAVENAGG